MSQEKTGGKPQPEAAALTEAALAHHLDTSLLAVMAVACGVFVSNVYYNQPLLELLYRAFPQATGLVNLAPTVTQLGFACGLFFLVPLGDRIDRRKLILGQAGTLVLALICLATAPNAWTLLLASAGRRHVRICCPTNRAVRSGTRCTGSPWTRGRHRDEWCALRPFTG